MADVTARFARSAAVLESPRTDLAGFDEWFARTGERVRTTAERVPLTALDQWYQVPGTGDLRHRSGKFFTVHGLRVRMPDQAVPGWDQPIIDQPEVGILGILVKEFDGVPHLLMQAKAEPGNPGGLQLSPTVQATRSNYTGVHRGKPVPYLGYFRDTARQRVLADVRQSEQGAWFLRKRNRNMVVETSGDVEVLDGFRWFTLGQVYRLLARDDLVNMDARTVLACLPHASRPDGALHRMTDVLSWIAGARSLATVHTERVPLGALEAWRSDAMGYSHESGGFFDVIGVRVTAAGREVGTWHQPMIEPRGTGVIAFLRREFGGVPHVLAHVRTEPGYADVAELAPTVQCVPRSYDRLPPGARPRYLDEVLAAGAGRVRYEAVLSEEGGRFFHARNRYLVVDSDVPEDPGHPDYRWLTMHQLTRLLRHSHYLNVQARSLVACLRATEAAAG
ncbi:NDP-hexose 2,3-dehydratase family protein [Streptomyces sp. SPB074]|uniref:NDP-hexose 2,3-dehydratase family protein n=1 Tax=Streptomyces sp. (strain SPB074) TaxID=465543 RepID=UPI00017F13AC|nr:NDP-hexose 2,3-dehydratase family protein [Streptomyces sp. SPB074]EDY42539.2 dTDP-4-keto-6-deoxy-L-hexose2,3-dehydratase [Streptomyces sp. SPB074]